MSFQGHIEAGVVVFDEPISLPEGTVVRIEPVATSKERWDAAVKAVRELKDYDYAAHEAQEKCDLRHAHDHLP